MRNSHGLVRLVVNIYSYFVTAKVPRLFTGELDESAVDGGYRVHATRMKLLVCRCWRVGIVTLARSSGANRLNRFPVVRAR